MTSLPLLAVENLEVVYHRTITAVQGISLSVSSGQIVAVLGTNGAGKTTLLRAISGFIGLDHAMVIAGTISFKGRRIVNLPPDQVARLGIVVVPERDKVFPNLTVAENLFVPVPSKVDPIREKDAMVYDFFPRLADLKDRPAGLLSGGERQMLALGSALMCSPEILLVDELSSGLAPIVITDLMKRLIKIRTELGISILKVEQSATTALSVADYVYVLENGQVVLDGDRARIESHQDVQEFYLGRTASGERRNYRNIKQYRRSRRWYG